MIIFYDNINIGKRLVDFFVEEKIMVELKVISELEKRDITQGLNYLEASRNEIALLLNLDRPLFNSIDCISKKVSFEINRIIKIYPINPIKSQASWSGGIISL